MSYFQSFGSKTDLFSSILLLLIVPSLVSGPFLPDLFLSLIAFIFLIKTIFDKKLLNYYNIKFTIIFFTFSTTILVSSFLSEKMLLSLESSLFYFRFYFFSIAIFYLLSKYDFLNKYFLFFCTFFLILYSLCQKLSSLCCTLY